MKTRIAARAVSICLTAAVTLAMLGGIDQLSQPPLSSAHWAQPTLPAEATPSQG